jgi:MscS family membrane protein
MGDTILVDGITGTVEGIGLRSTRIRTLDRTLVTIPNGKLADMKVETISYRDRMRSTQVIRLSAKSDPAKVDALVKKMRATLTAWKDVIADGTTVRVRAITEAATELEVIVSFATTDANEFNERQQMLIFELARAIDSCGLELGAPRPVAVPAP